MSYDFSTNPGTILTLTVRVKDKDIMPKLVAWIYQDKVNSEEGKKLMDSPYVQGLELISIGLGKSISPSEAQRAKELLAEVSKIFEVQS